MNPNLQSITIEGQIYTAGAFEANTPLMPVMPFAQTPFGAHLYTFLKNWFSASAHMNVRTSGSTGEPKPMQIEKASMVNSARMTCEFLGLQPGNSALLCMPLDYIAGQMMVVRALTAQLDLHVVTPCANPLAHTQQPFAFAAMTPMQVFNSLQHDAQRQRLMAITHLIIGGGAIDAQMAQALKPFPHHVYSTYGMTETLSHIALRRLNGEQASERYYPFASVELSLGPDETLIINAPQVAQETLYTRDIAQIYEDGSFRIQGRKDNIINSGGIKIQAEEVERLLEPIIPAPFAITSIPDEQYGEIVVLAYEKDYDEQLIRKVLPKYYVPKKTFKLNPLPLTETKKIQRAELKKMVLEMANSGKK